MDKIKFYHSKSKKNKHHKLAYCALNKLTGHMGGNTDHNSWKSFHNSRLSVSNVTNGTDVNGSLATAQTQTQVTARKPSLHEKWTVSMMFGSVCLTLMKNAFIYQPYLAKSASVIKQQRVKVSKENTPDDLWSERCELWLLQGWEILSQKPSADLLKLIILLHSSSGGRLTVSLRTDAQELRKKITKEGDDAALKPCQQHSSSASQNFHFCQPTYIFRPSQTRIRNEVCETSSHSSTPPSLSCKNKWNKTIFISSLDCVDLPASKTACH